MLNLFAAPKNRIRVLVADDHVPWVESLVAMLELHERLEVVGRLFDCAEPLERLAAAAAVAPRPAGRRAEDVLERRVGRAAVRAPERVRPELHELRFAGAARAGGRKTTRAELLATRRRDPVGRPRVVEDHV